MGENEKIKVLFICTGNICRSPMAEAVFKHLVTKEGLDEFFHIESAGTSAFHIGERPHLGTQKVLEMNGVSIDEKLRAQRLNLYKARDFDYLIAMDSGHLNAIRDLPNAHLLLQFAPQLGEKNVPDPYYDDSFDRVYDLVLEGSKGLLAYIRRHESI